MAGSKVSFVPTAIQDHPQLSISGAVFVAFCMGQALVLATAGKTKCLTCAPRWMMLRHGSKRNCPGRLLVFRVSSLANWHEETCLACCFDRFLTKLQIFSPPPHSGSLYRFTQCLWVYRDPCGGYRQKWLTAHAQDCVASGTSELMFLQ
ncbi:hypothetical protein BJY01DRAFT_223177 [Aspergillus pseudoustus]|uniref:Uncharacterized protein n=1 Tax=Aspergillus pseudoustus TaxID=1810923 RepID=A0ABR4J9N8_9EURO